jgi:hypothetical protein
MIDLEYRHAVETVLHAIRARVVASPEDHELVEADPRSVRSSMPSQKADYRPACAINRASGDTWGGLAPIHDGTSALAGKPSNGFHHDTVGVRVQVCW